MAAPDDGALFAILTNFHVAHSAAGLLAGEHVDESVRTHIIR